MSKDKAVLKKYGKPRIEMMFAFLEKLTRYYDYPYHESNLYDFLEDLEVFSDEDIKSCLNALKERESTYRLKFNEIFRICKEVKNLRVTREEEENEEEITSGITMPKTFKEKYVDPVFRGEK